MSVRVSLTVPMVVAAAAVVLVTRQPVSDSDLFWHLANGRDVLAGVAGTDHESWTVAGNAVPMDQWLGDLVWYGAYALGGWTGVIALRALVVGAFAFVVVATALAAAPRRPLIALLAALPALVVARYAWTDRPELFGVLCFAVLIALLRTERALLEVALLFLVWSNLHGSWALGLVLALLALGHRALARPDRRRQAILIAALCVVACVPTLVREQLLTTSQFWRPPREISEWSVPDVTTMPGLAFALTLAATIVLAFAARRRDDRDVVLLVPTLFVAMSAQRHMPFFPVAAAAFLARAGTEVWERASGTEAGADALGPLARAAAGVVLALAFVGGIATAPSAPDLTGYPSAALASLPSGPGMLNQYDWGGYLIWYAPRTPVFVDGRLVPYRASGVLDDYRAVVAAHPGWEAIADRRGIRTMLVRPGDAIAVRAPDRGWHVAYADATAVVLVR